MDKIELLRKRLFYQSCHRGCKESDYLLEKFAQNYLEKLSIDELSLYEKILMLDDLDLYNWISGREELPPKFNNAVMQKIIAVNTLNES
jgi:antitoxin CptB